MPWKETQAVDERVQLIAECLEGQETIADVCRRFGVSRKTAYKWLARYKEDGPSGLAARSTKPHSNKRRPTDAVVATILDARRRHPTWGPGKLRVWLLDKSPALQLPAVSTMGDLLKEYGLVRPRRRRRHTPPFEYPFSSCVAPNDVWCVDFKGHFKMGDKMRCHPLTMTDAHSRFLLLCKGMSGPTLVSTKRAMDTAFREFGLPNAMRSDNGTPFAGSGAGGLSQLSVWWLRLGILPERIEPGKPQQNGRHERFHRTLKDSTARPASLNLRAQQKAFNRFMAEYNHERPHESLGNVPPVRIHKLSTRVFPRRLPEMEHPDDVELRKVISNGRVRWRGQLLFVNSALTGEHVAIHDEREDGRLEFRYGPIHLGFYDERRPGLGLVRNTRPPRRASIRR